jgi:ribosomal protein L40E
MEHICTQDICLRCEERLTLHAWGQWGCTACPDERSEPEVTP